MQFAELQRVIAGISPKMLIQELIDVGITGIVSRQTFNTFPITVAYSLTEEGLTLNPILEQIEM